MLAARAASVTGVDASENMIIEAKRMADEKGSTAKFCVDSCESLRTVADQSIDVVISNYVLMDLADLGSAVGSFHRVLKDGGIAVCVFSHPMGSELSQEENYFDEVKKTSRWGPFDSEFIYFHRPLSAYWRAFREAGFLIDAFDEPVAQDPNVDGFKEEWKLTYRRRPWSVAFRLKK
jgi:ubiquinone/menaquinone biosynthesis C-methylase UbiE